MALLPLTFLSPSAILLGIDLHRHTVIKKGCPYLLRIHTVLLITKSEYLLNINEFIFPTFLWCTVTV